MEEHKNKNVQNEFNPIVCMLLIRFGVRHWISGMIITMRHHLR